MSTIFYDRYGYRPERASSFNSLTPSGFSAHGKG